MKNSTDTIGNRTRDLPVCSTVPHGPTPLGRSKKTTRNGSRQLLSYVDRVKLLDENVNIIKKITEVLLDNVRRVGLEVNREETKCKFASCHQHVKQNGNEGSEYVIRKRGNVQVLENNSSKSKLFSRSN
jgi:hypothetical protein